MQSPAPLDAADLLPISLFHPGARAPLVRFGYSKTLEADGGTACREAECYAAHKSCNRA